MREHSTRRKLHTSSSPPASSEAFLKSIFLPRVLGPEMMFAVSSAASSSAFAGKKERATSVYAFEEGRNKQRTKRVFFRAKKLIVAKCVEDNSPSSTSVSSTSSLSPVLGPASAFPCLDSSGTSSAFDLEADRAASQSVCMAHEHCKKA